MSAALGLGGARMRMKLPRQLRLLRGTRCFAAGFAALLLLSARTLQQALARDAGDLAFAGLRSQSGRLSGRTALAATGLAPGKYKALTRIRLRESPDVASGATGSRLEPGEVFEADDVSDGAGLAYLRVAGKGGWVFDQGIAGRWEGKAIVERLEQEVAAASSATVTPTVEVASAAAAARAEPVEPLEPVVALATAKVETVRLPSNMLGAGFELVQLQAKGAKSPLTFVLGSGFPVNAVTDKGRAMLGKAEAVYTGGWASQAAAAAKVDLEDLSFVGTNAPIDDLKGVDVFDFPQAQLLEQLGVEVHGILGTPFYELYDVDLDRYAQRLTLYTPGQASKQGFYSTVRHMPGLALPAKNLGLAVRTKGVVGDEMKTSYFVGLVDTSAAHTVLNWEAAKLLGIEGPNDPAVQGATKVLGAGPKGQPEEMPVVQARLSLCGVLEGAKPMMKSVSKEDWDAKGGEGWYFESLSDGTGIIDMGTINVAIGDVFGLQVLDDSKIGKFTGPAAIVGQDLLFQAQRIVVNHEDKQFWMEPGDIRDEAEM